MPNLLGSVCFLLGQLHHFSLWFEIWQVGHNIGKSFRVRLHHRSLDFQSGSLATFVLCSALPPI
jgi:hypothetical protein